MSSMISGSKTTMSTKSPEKQILLDADGVLLNWNAGFNAWAKERGYVEVDTTDYDMAKRYRMPVETIVALIEEYNRSAAVSFLFPMPGSVLIVGKLRELGYEPVCISSFGGDTYSQIQRQRLLYDYFRIDPRNCHLLPTNGDKREVLSRWKDSHLPWVEDKLSNALLGKELGLDSILLRSDHTRDYVSNEIFVADSWYKIHDYLTGETTCRTCPTNGSLSTLPLQPSTVS